MCEDFLPLGNGVGSLCNDKSCVTLDPTGGEQVDKEGLCMPSSQIEMAGGAGVVTHAWNPST